MIRRLLLAAARSLLAPAPALAWWEYGHETVARIAWLEVSPRTRAEIRRLMAAERGCSTRRPARRARSRRRATGPTASRRWASGSATPRPGTIRMSTSASRSTSPRPAATAIASPPRSSASCACSPTAGCRARERLMALGLPRPFHGRPSPADACRRPWRSRRQPGAGHLRDHRRRTNLHSAWDGYLADRGMSTPPGDADGILSELSAADKAAMRQGGVADWARESWEAAREFAYGTMFADPCALPAGPCRRSDR